MDTNSINQIYISGLGIGTYVFNTTDLCGNQQQITILINEIENTPVTYYFSNGDCVSGSINFLTITGLVLNSAPASYTATTLPLDGEVISIRRGIFNLPTIHTLVCNISTSLV